MKRKNVEKITSVIMRLSNGDYTLKHVTRVGTKDKLGKRKDYHTLVVYDNDTAYKDVRRLENINLTFKSYLVLEETKGGFGKVSVQINEFNIHKIIKKFKKIKKWFTSKKNIDLFVRDHGQLKLNKEMASTNKKFNKKINCGFDTTLQIVPAVINDRENSYEGILVFINGKRDKYFEMTIDELRTFIYKLKKINLYEAGLMMCNYIGRPKDDEEETVYMTKEVSTQRLIEDYHIKNNLDTGNNQLKNDLGGYFR